MGTTDPSHGRTHPHLHGQADDVQVILEELRGLVYGFADTPPDRVTPHFYAHAFNEYDMAVRALLHATDVRGDGDPDR